MSFYYKVPMRHADWQLGEYWNAALSALLPDGKSLDRRQELANFITDRYQGQVILFNSGRSALESALRNIRQRTDPGQSSILTPSLVCDSVPQKICTAGFQPRFYETAENMGPDLESLSRRIDDRTAGVVVPYVYGKVINIDHVAAECRQRNIPLIEDCASSFLLPDQNGRISGWAGDYVVLSFQVGKTIASGSGGALIHRLNGKPWPTEPQPWTSSQERQLATGKTGFAWMYTMGSLGYLRQKFFGPANEGLSKLSINEHYTMGCVDSGIVMRQLDRWEDSFQKKLHILKRYAQNLAASPELRLPQYEPGSYVQRLFVQFPYPVLERRGNAVWSPVQDFLKANGIQVQAPYEPAHRLAAFEAFADTPLERTDQIASSAIAVPSQPGLSDAQIDYVCRYLVEAARAIPPLK